MNYYDVNDYELLSYVSDCEDANELIFEKYKPLIINNATNMMKYCKSSGVDINDLIQEGLYGLNIAIKSYTDNKTASFYTFASRCINNRMISLIVSSRRLKNKVLNDSVFLEMNDKDNLSNLGKNICDNSFNPEEILLEIEGKNKILDAIENCLNENEKQVIYLKIDGYKYKEIANKLGKSTKYVDNIIRRIRNKMKDYLDDK